MRTQPYTTMNQNPLSQIQAYLTKTFFVPKTAISPDLLLRRLALSTAEFMEIVFVPETQNQITLPDDELQRVRTVGDLALPAEQSLISVSN
mgnify:CR=1 FL=1